MPLWPWTSLRRRRDASDMRAPRGRRHLADSMVRVVRGASGAEKRSPSSASGATTLVSKSRASSKDSINSRGRRGLSKASSGPEDGRGPTVRRGFDVTVETKSSQPTPTQYPHRLGPSRSSTLYPAVCPHRPDQLLHFNINGELRNEPLPSGETQVIFLPYRSTAMIYHGKYRLKGDLLRQALHLLGGRARYRCQAVCEGPLPTVMPDYTPGTYQMMWIEGFKRDFFAGLRKDEWSEIRLEKLPTFTH